MREVCKVRRKFKRVLKEDIQRREKATGSNIEGLMAAVRVKEAWDHLVRWYCHARGKQVQLTREGLERESMVRDELYRCRPPERLKVPILVQPTEVNDEVPKEAEVDMKVQGMRVGRAGYPSGMRVDYLKGWRKEAKLEKEQIGRRWYLVVWLVQVMFRDRTMPVEIAWSKMVLVPKGKGDYRGTGLLEVLCKVFAVVVNCQLKRSFVLHDMLHMFRTGRGTRTETLEAKLAHNLAGLAYKTIF